MIILGLNHGEINSSAAIVQDGKVVTGAAEERFNRQKRTKAFPRQAIEYCLSYLGLKLADCDAIAQAWNPGAAWHKYNPVLSGVRIKREDYFYTVPDNLYNLAQRSPGDWVQMSFSEEGGLAPIYYIQHHRAHAANAFFLSPFERAAILTCDCKGEFESTTFGLGSGNAIKALKAQNLPDSLGMFYATYTDLLGYQPDNDEWKVMALSAFKVNYEAYYKKIRGTIKLLEDGLFELDHSYYKGFIVDQPNHYTDKLIRLLGGRIGRPGEEPREWHFAVARAMQKVAEEIAFHMLNGLFRQTKCRNLVLGGGFFMNSVFNGKVIGNSPFKNLYVPYAPADLGNSIGAALYVSHCVKKEKRKFGHNSSFIGPEFSDQEIERALTRRRIKFKVVPDYEKEVARLLSEGKIVALLTGRMEFGERALGHRSILADPRRPEMKDKINAIIKYRESYRPFAPAVLADKASKYFEVAKGYECDYMEKVVPVKREYRAKLPAITHVDSSGRIQTVAKEDNRTFYKIIAEFEKLTGFPVVLNTSFNLNGEPIVLSPDNALNTFFNSGLEHLFLGRYLITKE